MKYAKINNNEFEIIKTAKVIPDEMLIKKGFSKITEDNVVLKDWESIKGKATFELVDGVVVKTHPIKTLTLAKYKKQAINSMKLELNKGFPPLFKQLNALFGLYTEVKTANIKSKVEDALALIDAKEALINAASTYEEVQGVTY